MPISPFSLWQSFQSYVNTYVGGWFRPQTDFQQATNDISNDMWEDKTKQANKSQEIQDDLSPFFRTKNRIVTPRSAFYGTFTAPDDYGRYGSARILLENGKCVPCKELVPGPESDQGKCDQINTESQDQISEEYYENICERQIDKIDNARWGAVCSHKTHGPTLDEPKLTQYSVETTGPNNTKISQISFKVAPRRVSVVVLDYYVRPVPCVFAFNKAPGNVQTGAGDQLIYNSGNSTPLQWPSTVINEFLWRLGERYGLFTRDQFMAQASTQQKEMK